MWVARLFKFRNLRAKKQFYFIVWECSGYFFKMWYIF